MTFAKRQKREQSKGKQPTFTQTWTITKSQILFKVDLISSIFHVTDEGLRPKRFYSLLNFLTF